MVLVVGEGAALAKGLPENGLHDPRSLAAQAYYSHTHTHERMHARTHALARTHTRKRTHTHAYIHTKKTYFTTPLPCKAGMLYTHTRALSLFHTHTHTHIHNMNGFHSWCSNANGLGFKV